MSVCVSPSIAAPLMIDESLSCPQCPKVFASNKLLQQHQQMFHSDKSFICETCGKAFRFRSNLAEHRSVHTALKPYVCKFCGKSSRLKGNLTKHILKHHKKEQNEAIGKDDIIIKKVHSRVCNGRRPTKTDCAVQEPVATASVDYIEKPLFSVTTTPTNGTTAPSLLPKEETSDQERSILISLGLDYNTTLNLRGDSPEVSVSPENGLLHPKVEIVDDEEYESSPLPTNTVGGETSLAALIAQVNSPPPCGNGSNGNGKSSISTQCTECGKHVRKSSYLPVHMTLHHGYPPPSNFTSDEKTSDDGNSAADDVQCELRAIGNAICEIKSQLLAPNKSEQLLSGLDTRVGRLEKNLEMAMNSIYTLVQLQTGVSSNVTRFKEEAFQTLQAIQTHLEQMK